MARKNALGKGLSSLIKETALPEVPKANLAKAKISEGSTLMLALEDIVPNPGQPRKIFKEAQLAELAASIKENGILQPLIVTEAKEGKHELIAGERRLRASELAGLERVPVIIKKVTDKEKLVFAILENIQRSDLNCVEEALAYFQLMNDFNLTQEEVAKRLGKERSSVANFLRILKLPRQVIEFLQRDELSMGHGKILAGVSDRNQVIELAKTAAKESMSVRELERLARTNKAQKSPTRKANAFQARLDPLKNKLEQETGFHFSLKSNALGKGEFKIKFSSEDEFNTIYDYLLNR